MRVSIPKETSYFRLDPIKQLIGNFKTEKKFLVWYCLMLRQYNIKSEKREYSTFFLPQLQILIFVALNSEYRMGKKCNNEIKKNLNHQDIFRVWLHSKKKRKKNCGLQQLSYKLDFPQDFSLSTDCVLYYEYICT